MNESTTIADEVYSIVAKKAGKAVASLADNMTFDFDLELNELAHVELIMQLEDTFGVEFPDDDFFEETVTIGDVIKHIVLFEQRPTHCTGTDYESH